MFFSIAFHAQKLLINEHPEKLNTKTTGTDIGKNIVLNTINDEHIKNAIIEFFIYIIDNINEFFTIWWSFKFTDTTIG